MEDDDDDEFNLEVVDISYGKFFGKVKSRRSSSGKQKKLLKLRVPADDDTHSSTHHQLNRIQSARKAATVPAGQGPSSSGDASNNISGSAVNTAAATLTSIVCDNDASDSDVDYAEDRLEFGQLSEVSGKEHPIIIEMKVGVLSGTCVLPTNKHCQRGDVYPLLGTWKKCFFHSIKE